MNPFTVLGLPTDPDVSDEQVRAAWRAIAAATHPDRPDGGNITQYTAAANAYAQLRTAWGRSEAYADLAVDESYIVADAPLRRPANGARQLVRTGWLIPARIWCGRPRRLALRALLTALLSLTVVNLLPGQPSGSAVVTGPVTWFVLTARGDLAPPPGG